MWRLLLSGATLIAMASGAAAQSSSSAPSTSITGPAQPSGYGLGVGNGAMVSGTTGITTGLPRSGNLGSACSADTSCASIPLTPSTAANPSLAPRLSPAIGTQTGGATLGPTSGGTRNPTGVLNSAGGLSLNPAGGALANPASPTTAATSSKIGGLNQTGSSLANPAFGVQPAPTGGAPASRAPSMTSNTFEEQCANSLSCGALQGQ